MVDSKIAAIDREVYDGVDIDQTTMKSHVKKIIIMEENRPRVTINLVQESQDRDIMTNKICQAHIFPGCWE